METAASHQLPGPLDEVMLVSNDILLFLGLSTVSTEPATIEHHSRIVQSIYCYARVAESLTLGISEEEFESLGIEYADT